MAALITIEEARQRILAAASPLRTELVALDQAVGRYLACDVLAAADMPPFHSSAMDGYAVEAGPAGRSLRVIGESRAGAPSADQVSPGEAIRISTGAEVPAGATAVVPQEDAGLEGDTLVVRGELEEGANIRPAGEVMRAGQVVLNRGARIGPAELAAAASAGAASVSAGARPRVTVLSTGDELREPGAALAEGEIYDSNGPMLAALAARAGATVSEPERLPDDPGVTHAALARALERSDVIVIAGGVSVGPHDHVKPALAQLGVAELLWGIALVPGKPTWAGTRGATLVFGLPGNPVSAAVTFQLFAAPALAALQGAAKPLPPRTAIALGAAVMRNRAREQALRVRVEHDNGQTVAVPNGPQASHHLTSLLGADGLVFIAPGEGLVPAGTPVALEALWH